MNTVTDAADGNPTRPTRPTARSGMPAEIAPTYTEIPDALFEHAGALGLTFADVGFIGALWSFKWFADSPLNPSMDTLAERVGASRRTVSRQVARLESKVLLVVRRVGPGTSAPVAEYDLTPLWEALAAIVREKRPDLRVVAPGGSVPLAPGRSGRAPGGSGSVHRADLSPEVDEGEVDERESAGARRFKMHAQLRKDAEDPSVLPWKRHQMLQRADEEERLYRRMVEFDAIAEAAGDEWNDADAM